MKKKTIILGMMLLMTSGFCLVGCGGSGSSTYEENSRNGIEKFSNGDFDSMTEEEKDAVDDFLEWQSENY